MLNERRSIHDGFDFDCPSGLDLFALRCGTLGHWRAARVRFEARLATLAREDAELRALRDAALAQTYPRLVGMRAQVERDGAFGRADDGAVSGREVARLRFLRWLHADGRLAEDTSVDGAADR